MGVPVCSRWHQCFLYAHSDARLAFRFVNKSRCSCSRLWLNTWASLSNQVMWWYPFSWSDLTEKPSCLPGFNFLTLLGGKLIKTQFVALYFCFALDVPWCNCRRRRCIRHPLLYSFHHDGRSVACHACFIHGLQCTLSLIFSLFLSPSLSLSNMIHLICSGSSSSN